MASAGPPARAQVAVPTPAGGVANIKMRVGGDVAEEFTYTPYMLFSKSRQRGVGVLRVLFVFTQHRTNSEGPQRFDVFICST